MKKQVIWASAIFIATIGSTIAGLYMVEMMFVEKTPAVKSSAELSGAAKKKLESGRQAADVGKTQDSLKDYQAAYDLYEQAGDTVQMASAQQSIAIAKKNLEIESAAQ